MNTDFSTDYRTPDTLHRLHDEARERAQRLRDETMDAFWTGMFDAVATQRVRARRAAERYASRIQRHFRLRARAQMSAPSRSY